jgi:hypothetical protein
MRFWDWTAEKTAWALGEQWAVAIKSVAPLGESCCLALATQTLKQSRRDGSENSPEQIYKIPD